MSNLVVAVFPDEVTAFEMRTALLRMQKEYLIDLEDAVVVTRDKNGKTKLDQVVNLTSAGAVGGGFWGLLIGLIFFLVVETEKLVIRSSDSLRRTVTAVEAGT